MRTYFATKPKYPIPDIEGSWQFIKYPCVAEIKYDGEYEYYTQAHLINKYGRVREDLPITNELAGFQGILVGELYYNDGKSFYDDILTHKFSDELKFYIFDILQYGNSWLPNEPLYYRRTLLETILPEKPHLVLAKQYVCKDKNAVLEVFNDAVKRGYEGIVVKNIHSPFVNGTCQNWFKIKHQDTLDVFCIGYKKGKTAIAIGTEAKKPIGAVGNAGHQFYEVLEKVKAQEIIGEDKEYNFVEPVFCIEIRHLGWIRGKMLRNATLIRERPDKDI